MFYGTKHKKKIINNKALSFIKLFGSSFYYIVVPLEKLRRFKCAI